MDSTKARRLQEKGGFHPFLKFTTSQAATPRKKPAKFYYEYVPGDLAAEDTQWHLLRYNLTQQHQADRERRRARREEAYLQVIKELSITQWKSLADIPLIMPAVPGYLTHVEDLARDRLRAVGIGKTHDIPVVCLFSYLRDDRYHEELEKQLGLFHRKEKIENYQRRSISETLGSWLYPRNYRYFSAFQQVIRIQKIKFAFDPFEFRKMPSRGGEDYCIDWKKFLLREEKSLYEELLSYKTRMVKRTRSFSADIASNR